jgi:hypothetical protein
VFYHHHHHHLRLHLPLSLQKLLLPSPVLPPILPRSRVAILPRSRVVLPLPAVPAESNDMKSTKGPIRSTLKSAVPSLSTVKFTSASSIR